MEEMVIKANCVELGGIGWEVLSKFANKTTYDTINNVISILSYVLEKYPQIKIFGTKQFDFYVDRHHEEMELSCNIEYQNGESHTIIVQGCNGLIEGFFVIDNMEMENVFEFFYDDCETPIFKPYDNLNRMI